MKILVVDDLPVNRKLLRITLRAGGHEPVEAVDGLEALERLRREGFDAVITDVLMPRMDGHSLCREIRRDPGLMHLPVIVTSATYLADSDQAVALDSGADDFLRFPAGPDQILDALLRVVRKPRSNPVGPPVSDAIKEYSEALVRALEAKNIELEATRSRLAAANEALHESEESFRRIFRVSPVAASLSDVETDQFVDVNERLNEMLGYTREELVGRTSVELGLWVDPSEREEMLSAVVASDSLRDREIRLRTKLGEILHALKSVELVTSGSKRLLLSAFYDITERRKAEAALRESEARYRALFDRGPLPMWIYDSDSLAFLEVNETAIRSYGYSKEEFLAMTLRDIRPPEDIPKLLAVVRGSPRSDHPGVWRHWRKDGSEIEVEVHTHQIGLTTSNLRIAVLQDVTEQRRLEKQLRHAQKMEAVGTLVSGIAHDFNNLLTPVLSYCDLLEGEIDVQYRDQIREIRKAGERAATITRQLLAFSRQQVLRPEVLDLNVIVREMESMLRPLLGENLVLRTVLSPRLGYVEADRGQIDQVLMNLVVNARDAMPSGGYLTIETRDASIDEVYAQRRVGMLPGSYVMLSVTDTGVGMDEEVKSRLFEPFFTTKGPGKGTGLGLATLYGIVKQSKGHVWVYSELGHGSSFKVYLPRSGEPILKTDSVPVIAVPPTLIGEETILVVEDDDAVRLATQIALERYGYSVLVTRGGEEALEVASLHQGTIHAMVSDVLMSGINGPELAVRIENLLPGIRVVLMSGYSEHTLRLTGDWSILEKPFTAEALARKLRQALDA